MNERLQLKQTGAFRVETPKEFLRRMVMNIAYDRIRTGLDEVNCRPMPESFDRFLRQGKSPPLWSFFYHFKLREALMKNSFEVRRIIRLEHHTVWMVRLRIPGGRHTHTKEEIKSLIHAALERAGCRLRIEDIDMIFEGQTITTAFIWDVGCPGELSAKSAPRIYQ